ncbi:MAG: methyltransferase domain-containing protein [Chloroflexi bacterium]|nr:MAG: methyltransferase domain-containing protein [Chloroflexota bacterium]
MLNLTTIQRYQPIIDDWPAFCDALSRPLPTAIWANPLRITPQKLADLLAADGIPFEPLAWHPGGFQLPADFKPGRHWAYLAGLYQTQEAVAAVPVLLLDPQPGERVLDLCAAPGNKTAQMAVKMNSTGTVIANDINAGRMRAARQIQERLGLVNVSTTVYNGASYPNNAGLFDKILVDAPCSCEGTSRKDPDVLTRAGPDVSARAADLQLALLRRAVHLCKPGGRIVYATCTYAPEENELVIHRLLEEFGPDVLHLLPARLDGFTASPGLTRWDGRALHPSLAQTMRIWPHQNDTGGFFVALLARTDRLTTVRQARRLDNPPDTSLPDAPPDPALLQTLSERFGLPPDLFAGYHILQTSRKRVNITAVDHRPPRMPVPDTIGMLFMNIGMRYPKLSTAAALMFGRAATRNVIPLTDDQLPLYLNCQPFPVSAAQTETCTGMGYVILHYRGYSLGVGRFYPAASGGRVQSLFPKGWSPDKGRPSSMQTVP